MKKFSLLAIMAVVSLGIAFTSCNSNKTMGSAKLTSEVDSVSYMLGQNSASNMKKQMTAQMESWPTPGNFDAYLAGFMKGLENADDSVYLGKDLQETELFVNGFFNRAQEILNSNNLAEGENFLAENKKRSGVITTESGLQYQVLTEGRGAKPKAEDVVRVHYTGTYIDGTMFDSTVQRGEPMEFPVGGVIAGWTEGLQLMPVGSKYMFWIPTELAYGTTRQDIQPNAMLTFEVELLDIVK